MIVKAAGGKCRNIGLFYSMRPTSFGLYSVKYVVNMVKGVHCIGKTSKLSLNNFPKMFAGYEYSFVWVFVSKKNDG